MGYLLDTNVISEHSRRKPNSRVLDWLRSLPIEEQYLSVLSVGEIRHGIERMEAGARKERLRLWLERDLQDLFGTRLLAVTSAVAKRWADGSLLVTPVRSQDSSLLSPLAEADCLLIRPPHAPAAAPGTAVPILPLDF